MGMATANDTIVSFVVECFMGGALVNGSILYLVDSDPESYGRSIGPGPVPSLVGREPLVHAFQKRLAFLVQYLEKLGDRLDRYAVVDGGSLEARRCFCRSCHVVCVGTR